MCSATYVDYLGINKIGLAIHNMAYFFSEIPDWKPVGLDLHQKFKKTGD